METSLNSARDKLIFVVVRCGPCATCVWVALHTAWGWLMLVWMAFRIYMVILSIADSHPMEKKGKMFIFDGILSHYNALCSIHVQRTAYIYYKRCTEKLKNSIQILCMHSAISQHTSAARPAIMSCKSGYMHWNCHCAKSPRTSPALFMHHITAILSVYGRFGLVTEVSAEVFREPGSYMQFWASKIERK